MDVRRRIAIWYDSVPIEGVLFDTPTADTIWAALPLEVVVERWGNELSMRVPIDVEHEPGAHQIVDPGTLSFWCDASRISIALGPTPISLGNECRLVGPTNQWGRLKGDLTALSQLDSGRTLRLDRLTP